MQRLHTSASGLLERVYREASRPAQQASLQKNQHVYTNKMLDYIILHVSQIILKTILITYGSRLCFHLGLSVFLFVVCQLRYLKKYCTNFADFHEGLCNS